MSEKEDGESYGDTMGSMSSNKRKQVQVVAMTDVSNKKQCGGGGGGGAVLSVVNAVNVDTTITTEPVDVASIIESADAQDIKCMEWTSLGGSCETGRSCHLVRFPHLSSASVLLDVGMTLEEGVNDHTIWADAPFWDHVDPTKLEAIVITHAHMDHMLGLLLFFDCFHKLFRGKLYMTEPTYFLGMLQLSTWLQNNKSGSNAPLFAHFRDRTTFEEMLRPHLVLVDLTSTIHLEACQTDLRFYYAGHLMGAVMVHMTSQSTNQTLLYTGDFTSKSSATLSGFYPVPHVDILVTESTHGVRRVDKWQDASATVHSRKKQILQAVCSGILSPPGSKRLLPISVASQAHDLLNILEEQWMRPNNQKLGLHQVPIYVVSDLVRTVETECTEKRRFDAWLRKDAERYIHTNRFVKWLSREEVRRDDCPIYDANKSCVVLATSGTMSGGSSSFEIWNRWKGDTRHRLVLTGRVPPGSAAAIQSYEAGQRSIEIFNSYHSDVDDICILAQQTTPFYVLLVHGENQCELQRIAHTLSSLPSSSRPQHVMPPPLGLPVLFYPRASE